MRRLFKYIANHSIHVLRQILQTSLRQIKCALTHHVVTEQDEDEVFRMGTYRTKCNRCNYPLLLRVDPADEDKNYYMLIEE